MKTSTKILLAVALLLLLAIVYLVVQRNDPDVKSWEENYRYDNKDPYGTFLLYEMMRRHYGESTFERIDSNLTERLPLETTSSGNYFFIGNHPYLDSAGVSHLLQFVREGNTAFFVSKSIPYLLTEELLDYYPLCGYYWNGYEIFRANRPRFQLVHPRLDTVFESPGYYFNRWGEQPYYWSYFDSLHLCGGDSTFVPLGYMDDERVNFSRLPYGAGYFYFHSAPLAFTNLNLIQQLGLEYAEKVFGHMQHGAVFWDAGAQNRPELAATNFSPNPLTGSPLKYILSQPPLAWAWYIGLIMAVLYLLFRAKRRQRIIPVLPENRNTSLEFLSSIGTLYYMQGRHKQMAERMMVLFLGFLRHNHYLPAGDLDDAFAERLSAIARLPLEQTQKFLLLYRNIERSNAITENTLVTFHLQLEAFYKALR